MGKILILYYSLDGTTQKLVNVVCEQFNLDNERIHPIKDLKSKSFLKFLIGGYQVINNKRPDFKPLKANFDNYDTIIIGSPIWARNIVPIIYSVLEKNIIKNKKIALFHTYKGNDSEALNKITPIIEKNNKLISTCACMAVNKDYETQKQKLISWVEDLIKANANQ